MLIASFEQINVPYVPPRFFPCLLPPCQWISCSFDALQTPRAHSTKLQAKRWRSFPVSLGRAVAPETYH